MPHYQTGGTHAATNTTSALNVTGGTTSRPRIVDFTLSTTGAPSSDAGIATQLRRSTTAGTGTSVTPNASDGSERAAVFTTLSNLSAEPTYSTGFVKHVAINPRATHRWVAYDQRAEFVSPATANNGHGFQITDAGGANTLVVDCGVVD